MSADTGAGIALGAFVGALLGMSVTPGATATVVGALVALLATFFGLGKPESLLGGRADNGRIIGFCIAALVATVIGTLVRTHDVLVPKTDGPLQALKTDLKAVGYADDEIKALIKSVYFSQPESVPIGTWNKDPAAGGPQFRAPE